MVRLTTLIADGETDADAERRLEDMMQVVVPELSRFIPGAYPSKNFKGLLWLPPGVQEVFYPNWRVI